MTEHEKNPSTPILRDAETEAHALKARGRDEEAPTEKPVAGQAPDEDGPDDVEGHAFRNSR